MTALLSKPIQVTYQWEVKANAQHIQNAKNMMDHLDIKLSAIETKQEIIFMLRNGMDAEYLVEHYGLKFNDNRRSMKLLRALSAERKKLMDLTRYESFQAFKDDVETVGVQASLERAFMEHFDNKIGRVPDDLEKLFQIHSTNQFDRFFKVMELM